MTATFWNGRRVFLTGHTGFKGSWMSLYLQHMGAVVRGYALAPERPTDLFYAAEVGTGMDSILGNINHFDPLRESVAGFAPEIVIHMAAQPLVRASYVDPLGTYETNVLGTARVLEAARRCASVRSIVVVTTDKCYENLEWAWPYREIDALGGHDPYSSSKACAELVCASYRSSFFAPERHAEHGVSLATARAGNVIGGGDWAADRLIPDLMRSFLAGEPVSIRNPAAVRPWQHVLEPLRGYLMLAQALYERGPEFGEAWNFGPDASDARPVEWIVDHVAKGWEPAPRWTRDGGAHPHEAHLLRLDCSKAAERLGWRPRLPLPEALRQTIAWYRAWQEGRESMRSFTVGQIEQYEATP